MAASLPLCAESGRREEDLNRWPPAASPIIRPSGWAKGRRDEIRALAPDRLQELLRSRRFQDRAGPDRRRRAERLRQVESGRGAALGDGRDVVQEHARLRDGGRHLRRLRPASLAQQRRGRPRARQFRPPRAGRVQRRRDDRGLRAASSASRARPIASTAARCAPATCSSCSPTLRPARARPRWCARARSARSSARSRRPRRLILEEAAGISGLHSRRHEAELRLKGAEDNLLRVEDVLKQIDAQIDSLKTPGAPVEPLPQSRRRHPPPRGAGPSDRLAGAREPASPRRGGKLDADLHRSRRAHPRAGRGGAPAGARRRRPAGLARRGGPPRRGAAPHHARARGARSRGEARAANGRPNSSGASPSSPATSSASRR